MGGHRQRIRHPRACKHEILASSSSLLGLLLQCGVDVSFSIKSHVSVCMLSLSSCVLTGWPHEGWVDASRVPGQEGDVQGLHAWQHPCKGSLLRLDVVQLRLDVGLGWSSLLFAVLWGGLFAQAHSIIYLTQMCDLALDRSLRCIFVCLNMDPNCDVMCGV